jgi:hypothetical protein
VTVAVAEGIIWLAGGALPIRPLIENEAFDPEAVQVIAAAFEDALRELGLSDRSDPLVELVARRIITFARQGERDPVKLRDLALKSLGD